MMLQWLMLLTLFVHNSLAFGLYDDIDDYDLWRRKRGGPAIENVCRKDILIMLDSSNSVGLTYFENIRKFLIKLIENLNVREDGTQLGFITFSSTDRTKKLLDVGEEKNATKLIKWLENLDYVNELMGGHTRTGLAFKKADNMFNETSPSNARPTIDDVILLFTDGEPRAKKTQRGEEGKVTERKLVVTYTEKLKKNNVKIIGVAAGTPEQNKLFIDDIRGWVSDPEQVAETSLNKLTQDKAVNELVNKLISPLCKNTAKPTTNPPGNCFCTGDVVIVPFTAYAKKGEITAQVEWPVPMECTGDASYNVDPADAKSGNSFGLGKHVITYSYSHTNDAVALKCPVKFTVATCECPRSIENFRATDLPGGVDKKSYVSWTAEPAPNCPAQPSPNNRRTPSGRFSAGEHTVTYKYRVANKFDLECSVKIVVPGEFCGDTAYDPATQVCCCGKVHSKKTDKHRCCGQNYINPGKKMCCQGDKPVALPGPCP